MQLLQISIFSILIFLMSCGEQTSNSSSPCDLGSCLGFDIRQCGEDVFSDEVLTTANIDDQTEQMVAWLLSNSIDVQVKLVENYYEAVCEACYICPESNRFFVQNKEGMSASETKDKLEALELFNLKVEDCQEIFCF